MDPSSSLSNGDVQMGVINGSGDLESSPPPAMPPPVSAFGVDDDDDPTLDRGHSLPNVEELRLSQGKSQDLGEEGERKAGGGCKLMFFLIFLVVVVLAVIIGVAVGVTNANAAKEAQAVDYNKYNGGVTEYTKYPSGDSTKSPNSDVTSSTYRPMTDAPATSTTSAPATTTTTGADRFAEVKQWLVLHGVSSQGDLGRDGSPQNLAAQFIATGDELAVPVPVSDGINTDTGYEFLTRYVLTVLYHYTGGTRWTFDMNFLKGHSHCGWYSILQYLDMSTEFRGVACDATTGKIYALFMNQNNLEGEIPRELGLLTTLESIDFDLNLLRGVIPGSFMKLTLLDNIFASGNRLEGPLPYWIDKLVNLKNINLSHNLLEGEIPHELANLSNLEGLALDNNLFTGPLDEKFDSTKFQGLRNLKQFYLENNQFTGQLGANFLKDMTQLAFLDVSDNRIGGGVLEHLFEMPNLEVLDLHDNDFSSLPATYPTNTKLSLLSLQKCKFANQKIPSGLGNLQRLNHLDLSQNMFTGEITPITNTNLTYLFLSENEFSPGPVPSWIQAMTRLEELGLKSAQRTGPIPSWFGDLSKLILLDLDENELTGTIPESLGSLEDLHVLLLNRNKLNSTIPATFANLQSLKLIFLDANTRIAGSLGTTFCANPNFIQKPVIVADCDICDPVGDCCAKCCQKGEECNDGVHVPDLDPIWQLGYQRVFFTFRREDYFEKEQYEGSEQTVPPGSSTSTP